MWSELDHFSITHISYYVSVTATRIPYKELWASFVGCECDTPAQLFSGSLLSVIACVRQCIWWPCQVRPRPAHRRRWVSDMTCAVDNKWWFVGMLFYRWHSAHLAVTQRIESASLLATFSHSDNLKTSLKEFHKSSCVLLLCLLWFREDNTGPFPTLIRMLFVHFCPRWIIYGSTMANSTI